MQCLVTRWKRHLGRLWSGYSWLCERVSSSGTSSCASRAPAMQSTLHAWLLSCTTDTEVSLCVYERVSWHCRHSVSSNDIWGLLFKRKSAHYIFYVSEMIASMLHIEAGFIDAWPGLGIISILHYSAAQQYCCGLQIFSAASVVNTIMICRIPNTATQPRWAHRLLQKNESLLQT